MEPEVLVGFETLARGFERELSSRKGTTSKAIDSSWLNNS